MDCEDKNDKIHDTVLIKQSNEYNLFIGQIDLQKRGRERSLRPKIMLAEHIMLTEYRLCFKGIPEVTNHWTRPRSLLKSTNHCYCQNYFQDPTKTCKQQHQNMTKKPFCLYQSVVFLVNMGGHPKLTIDLINRNKFYYST